MKRISILLLRAALFLLAVAPLGAQDETPPLLTMLAFVPDDPATYEGVPVVSYADYRAFEASRGIPTITIQDFQDETEATGLWIAAIQGLSSGPPLVQYALADMERTQELMGFSFFDIDRALSFGFPPRMGTALVGNFDLDSITAAYSARDFSQTEMDGATVWCGPKSCDSGLEQDLVGRDRADLFGGHLGRKEPFALLPDGYILNSTDIALVQAMIAAHQGKQSSLAENAFYLAAAEAVSADGVLRQAQMFKWSDLGVVSGAGLPGDAAQQIKELAESTDPLPAYALAVIADIWDDAGLADCA
jgi:hypothetical protein